jgi:hypothetical protein
LGCADKRFDRLSERDGQRSVERLQRSCRIRTVDQQLHLRRITGANVVSELWRNLQPGVSAPFANLTRHLVDALHFAHDPKCFRVHESIDELPALNGTIFVQDDEGHMFDVGIERVTERDHFHQRRKKHEEQRHRIAPDDDEFLEQHCAETAERFSFHAAFSFCSSAAYFALRVTNTSSSDGPIS